MVMTPISLGTQSNPARDTAAGAARLINCYVENAGEEGKARLPVYASDGFQSFANLTTSPGIRATMSFSDTVAYAVCGPTVYKITSSGVVTVIPGGVSVSGIVTMARNRKDETAQIGIVTSDNHYYILESDVLTEITLPDDAPPVVALAVFAGYFILGCENGEFYVTSLDEGTEIDDLEFAAAEANPDGLKTVKTRGDDVVLFGTRSTEFWSIAVDADFPLERAGAVSIGCYSASSVVELVVLREGSFTDSIAFIGTNADGALFGVMLLDGYGAVKISEPDLDDKIANEANPEAIQGLTWSLGGHVFYALSGTNWTYVYDTVTGRWHERKSANLDRWRISTAMAFANKTIVGDYALGRLYWMKRGLFNAVAAVTLTLRHSNDNANSWATPRLKTISGASDKKQRVKFNRLGQSKEDGKVLEFSMSNAVMEDGVGVSMTIQPPSIHAFPNPMRFHHVYVDVITGVSQTAGAKGVIGLTVDADAVRG